MAVGSVVLDVAGASSFFAERVRAGPAGLVADGAERAQAQTQARAQGGERRSVVAGADEIIAEMRSRSVREHGIGARADFSA